MGFGIFDQYMGPPKTTKKPAARPVARAPARPTVAPGLPRRVPPPIGKYARGPPQLPTDDALLGRAPHGAPQLPPITSFDAPLSPGIVAAVLAANPDEPKLPPLPPRRFSPPRTAAAPAASAAPAAASNPPTVNAWGKYTAIKKANADAASASTAAEQPAREFPPPPKTPAPRSRPKHVAAAQPVKANTGMFGPSWMRSLLAPSGISPYARAQEARAPPPTRTAPPARTTPAKAPAAAPARTMPPASAAAGPSRPPPPPRPSAAATSRTAGAPPRRNAPGLVTTPPEQWAKIDSRPDVPLPTPSAPHISISADVMEFFKSPIYLSADHQHLTQENWNSLNSWCTVRKVKLDGTSVLTLQDSVKLPKDLIRALHHRTLKAVRILAPDVNQQVAAPTVVKFSSLGLDPKSITPTANLGGSLPGTKDLVINLDVNLKHPRMLFGQLECRTSVVASMRSVTIIANKVSEYIPEKPLFNPYSLNVPPFGILDKALSTLNGSANQCSGKLKVILVGFEALPKSLLGISDGAFGSLTDLVAASAMKMHIRLNIVFVPRIAYIQEVGRDRWNFENVKHYSWWDASNSI